MVKNVGQCIKQCRIAKGMTQGELADMIGVSQNAIHMWEIGKRAPKKETLNRIYGVLGVRETITLGKQDGIPIENIIDDTEDSPEELDDKTPPSYGMTATQLNAKADNVSDYEACRNKVLCKMLWTPATKDEMIVAEYAINAFIREITGGSNETDHNRRDEDESDGI